MYSITGIKDMMYSITGSKDMHIVQNLSFQLGHNMTEHAAGRNMATICRLSRGHCMPQPFTSTQEWFHYAFSSADLKSECPVTAWISID